jgi:hypothetical protein
MLENTKMFLLKVGKHKQKNLSHYKLEQNEQLKSRSVTVGYTYGFNLVAQLN